MSVFIKVGDANLLAFKNNAKRQDVVAKKQEILRFSLTLTLKKSESKRARSEVLFDSEKTENELIESI